MKRLAISSLLLAGITGAQAPSPPPQLVRIGIAGRTQDATAYSLPPVASSILSGAYASVSATANSVAFGVCPRVGSKIQVKASWVGSEATLANHNLTGVSFFALSPMIGNATALPNAFADRDEVFSHPSAIFSFRWWASTTDGLWWASQPVHPSVPVPAPAHVEMRDEVAIPNAQGLAGLPLTYQPFIYSVTAGRWLCGDETIIVLAP